MGLRYRTLNFKELREKVHGPHRQIKQVTAEFVDREYPRVVMKVNDSVVSELSARSPEDALAKWPRLPLQ